MKINQVEELVGITKKNIRFYEEQGLLNPGRNPENGYREYGTADVERLMKIKLLRKLAVPIEEIKQLLEERTTLAKVMDDHLITLHHQQQNLEITRQMCQELAALPGDMGSLAAADFLEEMEKLERDGTQFMNIEKRDVAKKKVAPITVTIIVVLFMLSMMALLVWAAVNDPLPVLVMFIILVSLAIPVVGVIIALSQRLKEIDGGEEDEARKY